ncbi:putative nadph-dependent 1-acyldihydroxyacetone phosphate reductase protein [Phaeoacremonium minimum UCRPA7]|uniref:Putative nadph-dependent 1-acyldihydroxyacetone phosphate reductase protein n=1 Tax=Phaeoacremonium minimum (strain UCR-PA7) TaxID=1286976 RepID=R8BP59_PHAM7|nr:putative nadph-dependent 1-acyldihydroxyacetone phosphate reductase protein [Phaeoacremonium minimum UCRPA7]EOO01126.1 putative nadph-dependent 1-acyldihydroxyacetone phosphate reductase protein [Phaeoacremonium minimum UCRPA7]
MLSIKKMISPSSTEAVKGFHVIATARNPAVMQTLAGEGMSCLPLDVTDEDSVVTCQKAVTKLTGGTLDILVNNAGRTHTVPATDLSIPDVRQTFEVNVFGVMRMVSAFVPLLIPAKGLIINISSTSSLIPYVFGSAYTATKGAVNSYSRTLRQELRPFGVRVMVALPGTVKTNITQLPRSLPEGSLYKIIEDIYQWRLTFSKKTASMPPSEYARKLVEDALKPEWPVLFRSWLGRPDWHYYGGMAGLVWAASVVGEWTTDMVLYRMMKMPVLENLLKQEEKGIRVAPVSTDKMKVK